MRKIMLYGELGTRFQSEYTLNVKSPNEAIRALSSQVPGFKKFLLDAHNKGLHFKVFSNDREIDYKELSIQAKGEIKIVPVVAGANAEFRTLVGAALIAASFFSGPLAPYMFSTGVSLAIGGTMEFLSRGLISNPEPPEKADNKPSYAFQGAVNTLAQGHPVPIGYGRMIVGGAVISASITTESLLAGYEYVDQAASVDIWSHHSSVVPPTAPVNYTSRELIEHQAASQPFDPFYLPERWLYRYHYTAQVLQLRQL
jgi:predicted phage tail protein